MVAGRMSIMLRPKDFVRKRYFHRDPYARYLNAWHEFESRAGRSFEVCGGRKAFTAETPRESLGFKIRRRSGRCGQGNPQVY